MNASARFPAARNRSVLVSLLASSLAACSPSSSGGDDDQKRDAAAGSDGGGTAGSVVKKDGGAGGAGAAAGSGGAAAGSGAGGTSGFAGSGGGGSFGADAAAGAAGSSGSDAGATDTTGAPAGGAKILYAASGKDVHLFKLDSTTGVPTSVAGTVGKAEACAADRAYDLRVDPSGKFLAVTCDGPHTLAIMKIDPATGGLTRVANEGTGENPVNVAFHPMGTYVATANYGAGGSGSIFAFAADGKLSGRKNVGGTGTGTHGLRFHPSGKFIYFLGHSAAISQYAFSDGNATALSPAKVAAPDQAKIKHIEFSEDGKLAFVVRDGKPGKVISYKVDAAKGTLSEADVSDIIKPNQGNGDASDIAVRGQLAYASNGYYEGDYPTKDQNMISVFSFDPDGKLTHLQSAKTDGMGPKVIALDPDGAFLYTVHVAADKGMKGIVTFKVGADGKLAKAGPALSFDSSEGLAVVKLPKP